MIALRVKTTSLQEKTIVNTEKVSHVLKASVNAQTFNHRQWRGGNSPKLSDLAFLKATKQHNAAIILFLHLE